MSNPIENVRKIHEASMLKHEKHVIRFNLLLICYLIFCAIVTFSSFIFINNAEMYGLSNLQYSGHEAYLLLLLVFTAISLFGVICWYQWRMARFTRLMKEILILQS